MDERELTGQLQMTDFAATFTSLVDAILAPRSARAYSLVQVQFPPEVYLMLKPPA